MKKMKLIYFFWSFLFLINSSDSFAQICQSVKESDFNNDGISNSREVTTNTYDHNGNLLSILITEETPVDSLNSRKVTTNTYDANGNILLRIYVEEFPIGTVFSRDTTLNTYDANGNLLTRIFNRHPLLPNPTAKSSTTNTYEANGNLLTSTTINESPIGMIGSTSCTTNTYDNNGNLSTSIIIDKSPAGIPTSKSTLTNIHGINGVLVLSIAVSEDPVGIPVQRIIIENTYAENLEHIIRTIRQIELLESNISIGSVTSYTYDTNGNQLVRTIVEEFPFETPISKAITTNTYDASGNLLTSNTVNERPIGTQTNKTETNNTVCTAPCVKNILNLTDLSINVFRAANTISAKGSITPRGNVVFKAGNAITLLPGFHAPSTSSFSAEIEACELEEDNFNPIEQQQVAIHQNGIKIERELSLKIQPNPFSHSTTIRLFFPEETTKGGIRIFDANGQIVKTISTLNFTKGWNNIKFNADRLPNGFYYVAVKNSNRIITKKMVLVK